LKTLLLPALSLGLPFADNSFDVITSFETLEHLHERSMFVQELKRVLRQGGTLFLSTPNAVYTKPVNGRPSNPFHIHEYTPEELRAELGSHFKVKSLLGQTLSGSFQIPPFYDAQKRLPRDLATQLQLQPNQKTTAGELVTSSGAYQLKIGFSQAMVGGGSQ